MQEQVNKPIFVVGSPRSGTSVLTWCLGQHLNMFPVPESNWIGDLAVNIEICYQIGAARGNRSLLSAMDIQRDEFFAHFGRGINALILKHRGDLDRKRMIQGVQGRLKDRGFYGCDVTGELNADTTDAIRRYQIRSGLKVTGEMDSETLRSLNVNSNSVSSQPGSKSAVTQSNNVRPAQSSRTGQDSSPQSFTEPDHQPEPNQALPDVPNQSVPPQISKRMAFAEVQRQLSLGG